MIIRTRHTVERAFSLIEIMVAVTLLAVITVGLLAMFYQTQKAFRLGANQVDILESGRATMQLMSQDFQQAYPSYLTNVANLQVVTKGNARLDMPLPVGQRTNLLQEVAFLARSGNDGNNWLGITYRIEHNNRGFGVLYRSIIATNPALQNPAAFTREWRVVSSLFFTASQNAPAANFYRVADGVVHLRVRAFNEHGQTYTEGLRYEGFVATNSSPAVYEFVDRVPAYLELELAVVDPKAVKQLESRTAVLAARSYLTNQAYRVHLFSQRIPLRARHGDYAQFDLWPMP